MFFNRLFRFLRAFILSVVILIALFLLGINLPVSQRLIISKANRIFQDKGLPVSVDKATILVTGKIGLNGVRIITGGRDTIVFVQQIRVAVRPLPLLFKKVIVRNVVVGDAVVNLSKDNRTGKLNLISLFSPGKANPEIKKKPQKKWDINIEAANLKNIRFSYYDESNGIQIRQSVGKIRVGFDKFSLISRQLVAAYVTLEKVHGGITLRESSHKKNTGNKSPAIWKFKVIRLDLRDILFGLHQPDKKQRLEFSLSRGGISEAGLELASRRITVSRLNLREPGAFLFSTQTPDKPESGSKNASGNDFPGSWNITGDRIEIRHGSFHTRAYHNGSKGNAEEASFQIAKCNTTLKDLRLSRQESGFTMNRILLALENGFQINKGEMVFHSDSTLKSLLKINLRTASSRFNLKLEAGNDLAALMRAYRAVPFSLHIDETEISTRDMLAFFPHQKEQFSKSAKENFRLGVKCTVAGTADLLKIGNFTLNTSSGDALIISGQVTNITKPSSALFAVAFRTGTLTRSRLNDLIQLAGSSVNLPDIEPLTLQGRLDNTLNAPEFIMTLQGGSGNIAMDGSMNLQQKSYSLNMKYSGLEIGKLSGISDMGRFSGSLDLSGKEFIPDSMKIKASVAIDSAGYRGYTYRDIRIALDGDQGLYALEVNAADPSFQCNLTGTADHQRHFNQRSDIGFV